jgi:ammonia channel protein AmtB
VDYGGSTLHLLAATSALVALIALPARAVAGRPGATQLALPTLEDRGASGPGLRWTSRDEPYVPMPALHLPVLATAGAWLAVLGWIGWCSSTPLSAIGGPALPWPQRSLGLFLAVAGGTLSALFSSWLTTGEGNALMTARGAIGALVAVSAGLPFYPLWAALAVGAGAGLLVPLVHYAFDHLLRLEDATAVVAAHGFSALWGLLAVGLLASGQVGAGWNGVGTMAYLNVAGQGVSGRWVAIGWASDWPGQVQAQAFGIAAVVGAATIAMGVLMGSARGLVRAWHGERAPRRVVRRARRVPVPRFKVSVPAWLRRRYWVPVQQDASGEPDDLLQESALEGDLEPSQAEPERSESEALADAAEPDNEDAR